MARLMMNMGGDEVSVSFDYIFFGDIGFFVYFQANG